MTSGSKTQVRSFFIKRRNKMRKRMIIGLANLGLLAALAGVPGVAQDKMADEKAASDKMASDKMHADKMADDKMAKKKSKKHKGKRDRMEKMEKKGDGKM